jgi:hypothetical protein
MLKYGGKCEVCLGIGGLFIIFSFMQCVMGYVQNLQKTNSNNE